MIPPRMGHSRGVTRALGSLLFWALFCACAPYGDLREAAHAGDTKKLEVLLREKQSGDRLSSHGLRRTALALLEGEIERAAGETGGRRIASLSGCVEALKKPLSHRAEKLDIPGGVAALLLVEAERGRSDVDANWKSADEPHFRAAFARSLVRPEDERLPYFRDPDTEVRRAALDAALDALASAKKGSRSERPAKDGPAQEGPANAESSPSEFQEMQAISSRDPDVLCRSKAFTWLGRSISKDALQIIVDRFQTGDERTRLLALGALYQKAQHDAEAAGLLYELGVSESGRVGMEAAFFLLSLPELRDAKQPSLLAAQKLRAEAKLLEIARNGAVDERASSLARHPIDSPDWFAALKAATDPAGGNLTIVALSRLLNFSETRATATRDLFAYARGTDEMARRARRSLAEHGDAGIVPLLEQHLKSKDVELRREAAFNLLQLGREQSVATALADENVELRVELACSLHNRRP